jgi:L-iditol 2-dehydrogenase
MTENIVAVLNKVNDLKLETRPIPTPNSFEVLVSPKSVGICGSDVHYWTHGAIGDFIVKAPMILGHESAGIVIDVGSKVTNLKKGDRITLEPGVPCRICNYCKIGRYNLCKDMQFMATPPYNGAIAKFITHAADFCFKLPDHVSFDEGAMCEPLSVGIHACNRAGVQLGSHVLIMGAGPIGLMCLLAAKAAGAVVTILVDIKQERLKVANDLGATATLLATLDIKQEIQDRGLGPINVCIECSGAESAIKTAIKATDSGGVVVLVGLGPSEIKLPLVDAAVREVDIRGIFRYANCYPKALELISSGQVNVKPLITHHFDLNDVIKAFETARDMSGGAIKVCINF